MSKVILNNGYPDFSNFYFGPFLAFKNINPYLANTNLFTPTTYPPFIFWFLYPLTLLPLIVSEKLWTIGSIIALLLSLNLLLKIYNQKFISTEGLILSSLAFLAFPIKFSLGMGQINIYVLLLIIMFIYFLNKSKTYSGIFLGLSLMLKVFPLTVIYYLITTKKWKTIGYIFLTLILGLIFTLVFVKIEIITYFIQKIVPTLLDSWKGDYYNQSLTGALVRAGIYNNRGLIRDAITLIITLPILWVVFINKSKDKFITNLIIGTLLTLNLLINSFSWQHHFVWLLPSFFATYFYLKKSKAKNYLYYLLFFCYLLVSLNLKRPLDLPLLARSHVFLGTIILLTFQITLLYNSTKIKSLKIKAKFVNFYKNYLGSLSIFPT
jgi:hypothetical protein